VDGKGGRGSYSGLEEALQLVLDTLSTNTNTTATSAAGAPSTPSFLLTCLQVGEDILASAPSTEADDTVEIATTDKTDKTDKAGANKRSVDLVVHGVWRPLTELLGERFGDMFSVGIPSTLSHCYRCLTRFVQKLQVLCDPAYAEAIGRRLHGHPLVTSFFARWKLDLYFQLRCKEVFSRVDCACEATLRGGLTGSSTKHLADELYTQIGDSAGAVVAASAAGTASSLTAADCATLKAEVDRQLRLQIPMFVAFALELRTCLHPSVLLQPLVAKFLTLILRTLMRLEAHVALSCSVTTPSFPNKSDIEQLRLVYASATPSVTTGASATGPGAGTPAAKKTPGAAATPAATPAMAPVTPGATPLVLSVLALEELLLVAGDLHCLEGWLLAEFSTSAAAALGAKQSAGSSVGTFHIDLQGVDAVRAALVRQVAKLQGARGEIWTKITALLGGECRKALGAVKTAVVSKYRMTNKPAPESASAYVEAILLPLKTFLAQHAALVSKLSEDGNNKSAAGEGLRRWKVALAEEISLSFVEQVSALIETVKQMDSTLQRRSRLQTSGAGAGAVGNMSDSEKIALQIRLDVEAFGRELQQLGVDTTQVPAFKALSDLSIDANV